MLEHDPAGDPITGIRWTHKTPSGIAELLRRLDIEISADTDARLLRIRALHESGDERPEEFCGDGSEKKKRCHRDPSR